MGLVLGVGSEAEASLRRRSKGLCDGVICQSDNELDRWRIARSKGRKATRELVERGLWYSLGQSGRQPGGG